MDNDVLAAAALFTLTLVTLKMMKVRKPRRWSVRPVNRNRDITGQYRHFLKLKNIDEEQFFIYTRMSVRNFNLLLNLISSKIVKTSNRKSLNPQHRLAMTLQ